MLDFTQGVQLTALPPLSLYVHIPYCVKKCPYCDFNSHAIRGDTLPENAYITALLQDLQNELPRIWGRRIHSIFIGGGTPALFQAASIDQLLTGIRALLPLEPDLEITLEANPGVFEQNRFQGFRDAGINRLSLGVQSFDDKHLHALGRIHDGDDARRALDAAQGIFPRVNADLMYALPLQTPRQAVQDAQTAIASGVTHVSAYQLTLEPNTAFGHTPPAGLPDEDLLCDIENAVHETLFQAAFKRYEISAFARDDADCRHNLNYWQFGDYLGIGAGAHGKISYSDRIERSVKLRQPTAYLNAINEHGQADSLRQNIFRQDLPFEFMLNALRLSAGVPSALFQERCGLPLSRIAAPLQQARAAGLLHADHDRLCATAQGSRFLNELLAMFLP
ncbi:MAG: radical SAM family heme chaperone HemW [Neisseria sp.]|nr:radical SAM family heme chaperone HemW [Neisseria sp.]